MPHPDLPVLNHPSTQAAGQRVMSKVWGFYNSEGVLNGPDGFTKRLQTTGDYLCSERDVQPSLRCEQGRTTAGGRRDAAARQTDNLPEKLMGLCQRFVWSWYCISSPRISPQSVKATGPDAGHLFSCSKKKNRNMLDSTVFIQAISSFFSSTGSVNYIVKAAIFNTWVHLC